MAVSPRRGLPSVAYLPRLYSDSGLIAPGLVGLVLMLARFWDVFTDPVVGSVADRTRYDPLHEERPEVRQGVAMNLIEKLLFVVGIGIVLFGFVMVAGALGIMLEDESEWGTAESLGWMTMLGLLPAGGGVVLCRSMRRRGKARRHELNERTILRLAKENGGQLTIAEASLNMAVSSTEAKRILDQCHLSGLADIEVSDKGAVLYRFKML